MKIKGQLKYEHSYMTPSLKNKVAIKTLNFNRKISKSAIKDMLNRDGGIGNFEDIVYYYTRNCSEYISDSVDISNVELILPKEEEFDLKCMCYDDNYNIVGVAIIHITQELLYQLDSVDVEERDIIISKLVAKRLREQTYWYYFE